MLQGLTFYLQYVGSTHNYKNSRQARLSIYELGEDIFLLEYLHLIHRYTNEQTNERASEQANKQTNERANMRTKEQTNERTNERTSERTNEQTKKRYHICFCVKKQRNIRKKSNEN